MCFLTGRDTDVRVGAEAHGSLRTETSLHQTAVARGVPGAQLLLFALTRFQELLVVSEHLRNTHHNPKKCTHCPGKPKGCDNQQKIYRKIADSTIYRVFYILLRFFKNLVFLCVKWFSNFSMSRTHNILCILPGTTI